MGGGGSRLEDEQQHGCDLGRACAWGGVRCMACNMRAQERPKGVLQSQARVDASGVFGACIPTKLQPRRLDAVCAMGSRVRGKA